MVSSINHFSPKDPFPYGLVVKSSNPRFLATSPLYSPVPCRGGPFVIGFMSAPHELEFSLFFFTEKFHFQAFR